MAGATVATSPIGGQKPGNAAQKHGFARARGAGDAQDLASVNVEIEIIEDHLAGEPLRQPANADHDVALAVLHNQ